ncbi:chemotaxis protein MotC [Mesorhizobium sp. CAU 1741]|uniref:chemotaxis protein MotC n=1 Tax=Mesorhizobium sp. CAU 1741 TaxID=3140366 RepID=UPI00325B12FD
MIPKQPRLLHALAIAGWSIVATAAHATEETLQPYQMVRSLQLVQDRIADGDHAALPMQRKLLEMIDGRFRSAESTIFEDARNVDALMVYAMSGGNPATIADTIARVELDEDDRQATAGILGYLLGDVAQARKAMATIEPGRYHAEVAAFLSLVKGSILGVENANAGIAILDRARLESPGTLVEEAALRRTIALSVTAQDTQKFLSASEQYARRFLRSPYASQYAESFVSGVIALRHLDLDLAAVESTIGWMTNEQAKTVYLRLARRAAIDGDAELLDFASRRTDPGDDLPDDEDPRGALYSSISSVTSETVDQVLAKLRDLDSSRLSSKDRALLEAAKTVANEVVAPAPRPATLEPASEEVAVDEPTAEPAEPTETEALVTAARSKLEAIDKLLEETEQ